MLKYVIFKKDVIVKKFLFTLGAIMLFSGCATWEGIKSDSSDVADWSKEQINHGAQYIEEKTE